MAEFEISGSCFIVTGRNKEEMEKSAQATRQQIAFYGSTPAYRGVLELHGWGGLQDQLNAMSKKGRWSEMGALVDDEILNAFAVVAKPEDIAPELARRYGDVLDRVGFYMPGEIDPSRWSTVVSALKQV
jgi:hypothetical protein